ncbi:MAG: thiamine phosphate synthase [Acidobacteria bacterium]|nr:thiamine phosphate synthase [Acidobacteriota bacterium]
MQLIVVTSGHERVDEVELLRELAAAGMRRLLVSKPSWSTNRVRFLLQSIPKEMLAHVTLDGHHGIAEEIDVGGIALSDRASAKERAEFLRIRRARPTVEACGRFHSLAELDRQADTFTEAWVSPVFGSISKAGYRPAFEAEAVGKALEKLRIPAVALGGVRADRVAELAKLGFTSVAASGAIWGAADPVDAFKTLREACR